MEAARLRDRVTIEALVDVPNGQGGFKAEWTAFAKAEPAQVTPIGGEEGLRNAIEQATTSYRVRIRRRASLTVRPEHRLKWTSSAGEVMAIRSVLPDDREPRAFLVLVVEAGPLGGD